MLLVRYSEAYEEVGHGGTYYAVDHSPSYLWNAATHEISAALLPYTGTVMGREEAWQKDLTIQPRPSRSTRTVQSRPTDEEGSVLQSLSQSMSYEWSPRLS